MRKIDWKKGSGSLLFTCSIAIMSVWLVIFYLAIVSRNYSIAAATTRCDAIADSVAVYAQSYDYKYNHAQAQIMATTLTQYNSEALPNGELTSELSFETGPDSRHPETLTIKVKAKTPAPFADDPNANIVAQAETSVTSVDIYVDILVIPPGQSEVQNNIDNYVTPGENPDNSLTVP